MPNPTPIYYSDLIAPDSSITDAIAQLKELSAQYEASKARIQSTATEIAKGMQNVSGATEDQRQQIASAAKEAEKLAQDMTTLNAAELKVATAQRELTEAQREQNQLVKLRVQLAKSEEGSYNQLSAQYRILKIRINEMGEADEKAAKKKRELEAQARALYARMNELQTATGKYTLQVGNYERALGGALGVSTKFIEVLQDTSKATEILDGVMSALTSPIGLVVTAVGLATGALKLWGSTIHETQQTGDYFDYAMVEWNATWDYFKKAVATVDFSNFISGAQAAAVAGRRLAIVMDAVFERRGSIEIQKEQARQENEINLQRLRDQRLSAKERADAGQAYLDAMEPIYNQEIELAKEIEDAELDTLFASTNRRKFRTKEEAEAAKQELGIYVQRYNLNRQKIADATAYNQALDDLAAAEKGYARSTGAAQESFRQQIEANRKIINSASAELKDYAKVVAQYNLTSNTSVAEYQSAVKARMAAENAFAADNRRITTQINSQEASITNNLKSHTKQRKQIRQEETAEYWSEVAKREADAYQKYLDGLEDQRKAEEKAVMDAYTNQLKKDERIIDLRLAVAEEGSEEFLQLTLERIEKERELELDANHRLTEEMRVDEALINAKYDAQALKAREKFGEKAGEVVAEASAKGAKKARKHYGSIWDIIIPDTDDEETNEKLAGIREGIETFVASVMDSVSQLISLWKEEAEEAVKAADKQVDAAERVVDAEREAAANGYANNVRRAEMELALAKKTQEKALAEKEKANKAQMALETVMQATSLVTASANIWSSMSEIPIVGPALAIASIALMGGSFLATKIKAAQVTKESYGEGTVELLDGGSHASGHDISLGRKKDGTERRAEGGEFFAVINKRNSKRYRNEIPDVINAFNDGTFADKYVKASDGLAGYAVQVFGNADLSRLEGGVDAIRKQGEERHSIEGQMLVKRYKNLTQRVRI